MIVDAKRGFLRFASFFCCLSRPKSTGAQDERVEQGEVDQDADAGPSIRCAEGKCHVFITRALFIQKKVS